MHRRRACQTFWRKREVFWRVTRGRDRPENLIRPLYSESWDIELCSCYKNNCYAKIIHKPNLYFYAMVTVLPYTSASTLSQTCSVIYRATAAKIVDKIGMRTYCKAKKLDNVSAVPSGLYNCVMTS